MSTIGERIRQLRGEKTLDEFSKINGIHRVTLSRLEKGERTPDANFLQMVIQNTGICSEWLIMGTGKMYPERKVTPLVQPHYEEDKKVSDTSDAFIPLKQNQLVENIDFYKNKTSDMSDIRELQKEILEAFREQNRLVRENAELCIALEHAKLEIERKNLLIDRRDQRIRELEKENAQLRESRKGVSPVFRAATGEAN